MRLVAKLKQLCATKWFLPRALGGFLMAVPGIIGAWLLLSATPVPEEDMGIDPFLQFCGASFLTLAFGYLLLRRGAAEEEAERIKTLIREVMREEQKNEDSDKSS